ncbi:RNA 2',3'-cyclic phosphodiesterase [Carboxylicivirga taeanensis]|uniref:RNA 2',3'-cyclic phosphodiesterase n=1 Tax=Carboxylicivirga taeanensis TaxID=1416875 RepID=UPI003F6DB570
MRLFVAIDFSDKANELRAMQKPLCTVKCRLVASFHLTLKFIGEVDEQACQRIKRQLSKVSASSFSLKTSRLGSFKSYSQKAIWCGVQESVALSQLQSKIETVLADMPYRSSGFKPHITLARIKHPHKLSIKDRELISEAMEKEFCSSSLEVSRFLLLESVLSPQGPQYRQLQAYPLSGVWRDDDGPEEGD